MAPAPSKVAWKNMERRVAKLLGGTRLWRPDFGESMPDGESETHTWDTKCYANHAAVTLYRDCEKKYREFTGPARRFLLVLFSRTYPKTGDLVVVPARFYAQDQDVVGAFDAMVGLR